MSMNKKVYIIYVHGFRSSGETSTAKYLKKYLADSDEPNTEFEIISNDYDLNKPFDTINEINSTINEIRQHDKNSMIIVIGSSLGGFIANQIHHVYRILINPVLDPMNALKKHLNIKYEFYNKRIDNIKYAIIDNLAFKDYSLIAKHQFDYIDHEDNGVTFALFGTNDKIINDEKIFNKYYSNKIIYDGEHRLNENNIINELIPLIYKLISLNELYSSFKY